MLGKGEGKPLKMARVIKAKRPTSSKRIPNGLKPGSTVLHFIPVVKKPQKEAVTT